MACNGSGSGSGCQSNCYKNEEVVEAEASEWTKPAGTVTDPIANNLCIKCKLNYSISGYGGVDDGRFCADCFGSNLIGKFRFAVTSNAMISPTDKVLVAFSGGPSSRVALQFVNEMQLKAQKNYDASRDRSLPVFGVGVVFIDERSISPIPSHVIDTAIKDISLIVSNLAPPTKELHIVPIETIYSSSSNDGRDRLKKLVDAINDPTGKEDFLLHLRMLALQKIAAENGYNRLVLGSCTSRIACHVISGTAKGQGYSLSADIQYVDGRWEIPVVLPLRDCTIQEIKMFCRLDGLKTIELSNHHSGINALVSSFVTLLQEENPSREYTIIRTAGKLIPFHFNGIPEIDDCNVPLATQRRQKRYNNLKPPESISSESFCPICNSPLNKSDILGLSNQGSCQKTTDTFFAACCSSCRFQILPRDLSSREHFYSILPQPMVARVKQGSCDNLSLLREQIQDCLLSDGEDET